MARRAWSREEEQEALRLPWPEFHAKFPDRTFNSWEVKRRRVEKDGLAGVPERHQPVMGERRLTVGTEHIRFAIVSDTHGGSKFEQQSALMDFYRHAEDEGVQFFVHAGDVTQGSDRMHLGMELEVHAHGAYAQAQYVINSYPRAKVPTYMIGGNHDLSFFKDGGQNIVRQITEARDDLVFLGQDAAHFTVENVRAYIIHPSGAAQMPRLKAIAASLPRSKDVKLMISGHTHQYGAARHHGITILQVPCFQGRYGWMGAKGLVPDIGGVIVDIWQDGDGHVERISHEVKFYDEIEGDWDYEASHDVNIPWTDEGL